MALTQERIAELSNRKNVKKIAVENFLSSLGGMTMSDALANLGQDTRSYKWNPETARAIRTGVLEKFGA